MVSITSLTVAIDTGVASTSLQSLAAALVNAGQPAELAGNWATVEDEAGNAPNVIGRLKLVPSDEYLRLFTETAERLGANFVLVDGWPMIATPFVSERIAVDPDCFDAKFTQFLTEGGLTSRPAPPPAKDD